MRCKIKKYLLPFSILSLLTPALSFVSSLAYLTLGILEITVLQLTQGGAVSLLTLLCFLVLNLIFLFICVCCTIYSVQALQKNRTIKNIFCIIFSIIGLFLLLLYWILSLI